MARAFALLAATFASLLKSRVSLQLENLALRHQIGVLQGSAKKRPKLVAADRLFLGLAVPGLERLALGAGACQTGYGDWLASEGLPTILGLEGQARTTRTATGRQGDPRVDPENEPRQSVVGRTQDTR